MKRSLGDFYTQGGGEERREECALNSGAVLRQYRIVRLLGRGGMGEVYLAQHVHLKSYHALKVILSEFAGSETFRRRFLAEARVMAKLRHPRIVHVTDFGLEHGVSYLVMDYIQGPRGQPLLDKPTAAGYRYGASKKPLGEPP